MFIAPTTPYLYISVVPTSFDLKLHRFKIAFSDEFCFNWASMTSEDVSRDTQNDGGILSWLPCSTQPLDNLKLWSWVAFHFIVGLFWLPYMPPLHPRAQRYVDNIVRPIVVSILSRHLRPTFQQVNARSHTAINFTHCFRAYRTFSWTTNSLDLSATEHIWVWWANISDRPRIPLI